MTRARRAVAGIALGLVWVGLLAALVAGVAAQSQPETPALPPPAPAAPAPAPADTSASAPADTAASAPADTSTSAPADTSTTAPADTSTSALADTSAAALADTSASAPADTSAAAPADTTAPAPVAPKAAETRAPTSADSNPALGVHLRFDDLLDRRREIEQGRAVTFGAASRIESPLLRDVDPTSKTTFTYSPWTRTVYQVAAVGDAPAPPEYYFADGVYAVYDPNDFQDPGLRIRALPFAAAEAASVGSLRRDLWRERMRSSLGIGRESVPGQGIQVVVPIKMKGTMAEVFGHGATTIKVSGRENLSFAGESRRTSNFIANESGRGQSLFPRLDMKQELQVKLEGTIGDKVHVQVDHNSAGFGAEANRINIYYQGYDDDIVRRIDLGGTNLALPGSNLVSFSGGHQGLFGIKSEMWLGSVKMTMIASKEEAETQTQSISPTGGTPRQIIISENSYARDRFFFYEKPDTTFNGLGSYLTYGLRVDQLLSDGQTDNLRVFVDTQNANEIRDFVGYAVADLPSGSDSTATRIAYMQAPPEARFPPNQPTAGDSTNNNFRNLGKWKPVPPEDLGFVLFTKSDGNKAILGFFLRNGSAGRSDAIGIAIEGSLGQVGSVQGNEVRLKLIRHPEQDVDFHRFPTAQYMMRHVYALGSTDVTDLDVRILSDQPGRQNPDVPLRLNSTYLHMFGLDDQNSNGVLEPDGLFDIQNPNLLSRQEGLLFMPGLRPFSPPDSMIIRRLQALGIPRQAAQDSLDLLFLPQERVAEELYTLKADDPNLPHNQYHLEVGSRGTDNEIILPQDIIEGSEVVKLDGRVLVRGSDYDIESFAGGRITLKGPVLNDLSSTSNIEVTFQFRPLFGGGKSSLIGVAAESELGLRGRLGGVWLYESTGNANKRPKLGEEPTRTMVGDLNATMRFEPPWMTKLIDLLPFTYASAPSQLSLAAEGAISLPNPNTKKTAYVDDLEGADESDDQSMARTNWNWASIPIDQPARRDTLLRVPVAFYNPPNAEVKRGHLNPTLDERERNDGLVVLELGFDRAKAAALDSVATSAFKWSGVMRSFGTAGIDLSRTKSIEFWLNDFERDRHRRNGKIHIDMGDVSENFVFFRNRPDQGLTGPDNFNREAESATQFQVGLHDFGFDGRENGCNDDFPNDCRALEQEIPFGSDCYRPEAANCLEQHYLADGSEHNNQYDTEDINSNGILDDFNSYFSITLDLADSTFVLIDVDSLYRDDPTIDPELKEKFYGWRKYRIDLDRVMPDILKDGTLDPTFRKISAMRLWFEDGPGNTSIFQRDLQLYGLRLTRNQWTDLGVFGVDSTEVAPAPGESFTVGVINNKDDAAIYELPPDAIEIDEVGVQARSQSLRLGFVGLEAGHEVLADKQVASAGRGLDFTQYQRLTYFVHCPQPTTSAPVDSAEFFFRIGSDTLNYYEIAHVVPAKGAWLELNVDFDQLTGLKFPQDYPGAQVKQLRRGAQVIQQVSALTEDARDPTVPLLVTVRGTPSLASVTRFFVGVRHRHGPFAPPGTPVSGPISGEVWFDNVRLDNVEKSIGIAQQYSVLGKFSDVVDFSAQLSARDSEFRGLRQRTGGGSDVMGLQGRVATEVSRLVPTLGFSIPVSYNYGRDRALPKFFSASDTRNTEERKQEQRVENVRRGFGFSVTKRPSRFWLSKWTLDKIAFSYNHSRTEARTFATRDTSTSRSRSISYDISPRERLVGLGRVKIGLLPTNLKFSMQEQKSEAVGGTIKRSAPDSTGAVVDSLFQRPPSSSRSLTLSAGAALRPLQILSVRYNFQEPRDYRQTHPSNEIERYAIFGFDIGLPRGRSEALQVDLTPRRFRIGYSTTFNDQRTTFGTLRPETHQASTSRSARLQFDFALHRRLFGWVLPGPSDAPPPPRSPDEPPPEFIPPPEDPQGGGAPQREDFAPQEPHPTAPDTLTPVPPPVTEPEPEPEPSAAPLDSLPVEVPNDPQEQIEAPGDSVPAIPPDSLRESGVLPPPGTAIADSLAPKKRRRPPNPLTWALRTVAGIEPVKVEYSNGHNAGYVGLNDTPTGAFRYGFTDLSGLVGPERYSLPGTQDTRNTLDLQSAVPLTGSLRVSVRYKIDANVRRGRTFTEVGDLTNTSVNHTTETTFPALDLAINNVERIRLFGKRLERSNVTLGYSRRNTDQFSTNQVPGGPEIEASGRSESGNSTFTANWAGQWRRGVSTSLNLNQTTNSSITSGPIRGEGLTRSVQGTVRFKVSPKGGLRLPFLGDRGRLKSGMDVTFTGAYNTDQRQRFNNPAEPEKFILENQSSAIALGARSDYTLSRNMSGGFELGFTRTHNEIQDQTIMTVRLGFNITFLF